MRTQTERSARESGRGRDDGGAARGQDEYRVAYDEYRIKLYKVACRAAREEREQLRLEWDERNRQRD